MILDKIDFTDNILTYQSLMFICTWFINDISKIKLAFLNEVKEFKK